MSKQINNLKIKHKRYTPANEYYVQAPDGRVLEEFGTYGNAVRFCEETRDFIRSGKIKSRLEYLRGEIEAERISYGEIAELQSLAKYIDKGDIRLLEQAGVKEQI